MLPIIVWTLLSISAAAPLDNAPLENTPQGPSFPTSLTLDRVRLRRCGSQDLPNVSTCATALTRPQYAVFGDSGMTEVDQEALLLAEVSRPPRKDTESISFFIAGQQRRGAGNGRADGLTGKQDNFRPSATVASEPFTMPRGALARKLFAASGLPLERTFVSVVFAPVFDFTLAPDLKPKYVNAYVRYLLAALPPGKAPSTVLLAGHSRGGCLALLLAQELTHRFPRASVAVTAIDNVCVPAIPAVPAGAAELAATGVVRRNPLQAGLYVYTSDLKHVFAQRYCLFVNAYITGQGVIVREVRPLGYAGFGASTRRRNYLLRWRGELRRVFYREVWTKDSHTGVSYENHGDAVNWLRRGLQDNVRFGCQT